MAASDSRQRTRLATRLHFLIRVAGLVGVMVVFIGVAMALADATPAIRTWQAAKDYAVTNTRSVLDGGGTPFFRDVVWLTIGGLAAVALAVVVELIAAVTRITGRRTFANVSATLGTIAAIALLVFVNAYSFTHHQRFDLTRNEQFTLPSDLAERLRSLRAETRTTIVVLQKHEIFGTLSSDRDSFTKAAELKVTEKVQDLVDLFRELGARFNVEVLDTEAFEYRQRLADVTKDAPELRAAIEAAPENSIFFYANKRVQRLSFNEFLRLDKSASEAANNGRGNLVLMPQGIDNFARRVLTVQERRPKVAVCVVGEWFTPVEAEGNQEQLSLAGLKKALASNGFDVIDIVLKKNWPGARRLADLQPAAYTLEESTLERLEGDVTTAVARGRAAAREVAILGEVRKDFEAASKDPFRDRADLYQQISFAAQTYQWAEVAAAIRGWSEQNRGPAISETKIDALRAALDAGLARQLVRAKEKVEEAKKARYEAEENARAAYQDERAVEERREKDVKAKFSRLLDDVDLIIVPRHTLVNATSGDGLWAPIHSLDKVHVDVIKEFMKKGKPVLACMGSVSGEDGPEIEAADGFERLLAELGIELGRDTVLFDSEQRAFTDQLVGGLLGGGRGDVPPVVFVDKPRDQANGDTNTIAAAVHLTARSVDQKLDLRLRALRPVYLADSGKERLPVAAEFIITSPDSWNEEKPHPGRGAGNRVVSIPRYEPTLASDRKWNTRHAERRGPFPVGIAIESKVPAAWFDERYEAAQLAGGLLMPIDGILAAGTTLAAQQLDRPNARLVVLGSGHLFSGTELDPVREKLLLHTVNWLTKREDRLPHDEFPAWSFPRVDMSRRQVSLWQFGTALGLPLAAVFIGLLVMMVRRLR